MEPFIGVSYKLTKSENFDEYMKALGEAPLGRMIQVYTSRNRVGLMIRKLGNTLSPTVKLTGPVNGVYTFHTVSTFKNHTMTFKPGVEFDEETVDGRKVKSVVTFESNKMIQTQKDDKITTTIVREFKNDQMIAVFTVGDITCTRLYEKVN